MLTNLLCLGMTDMYHDETEKDNVEGVTYRTFNAWKSWGFKIKKGEKSHYRHPMFGSMFSSTRVYNPENRCYSVGKELNYLSRYEHV